MGPDSGAVPVMGADRLNSTEVVDQDRLVSSEGGPPVGSQSAASGKSHAARMGLACKMPKKKARVTFADDLPLGSEEPPEQRVFMSWSPWPTRRSARTG
jgi:hypothetical protein